VEHKGKTQVVSAESALKLLGYVDPGDKQAFTSLKSTARTVARLRMAQQQLEEKGKRWAKDWEDVELRTARPEIVAGPWEAMPWGRQRDWQMGTVNEPQIENRVGRASDDEMVQRLSKRWKQEQMKSKGWDYSWRDESMMQQAITRDRADLSKRLQRAEGKLKQAAAVARKPDASESALAVQSSGGAIAQPSATPGATPPAVKRGSVAEALKQTLGALKAADARQMGMIAEQLFEAGWTIDRRTRYRGMSKDQAREKFKAEFAQKMQAQASSPEANARATAMRQRAGASGTVSGALRSVLEDMKEQDKRLNDLQQQAIDLRVQAEEQFGGDGGEGPSLGGGRPRRRLGGGRRRDADILEARIDGLRVQYATMSR